MKKLMNLKSVSLLVSFVFMTLVFSCTKDSVRNADDGYSTDNEHIKSISAKNGAIVHQYHYDVAGRIVEENCLSYFQKYLYDENSRLIKVEAAFDETMYSSTFVEGRTEFMTSKNSEVKSYSLYKYDKMGRLTKTEHYFNMTGKEFELRSTRTFEYDGTNMVQVNLHNETGQITQYHVFTYDQNGNVTNDKYYSNLFGATDKLVSENSYKYDNYKNPYRIFSMTGSPGMYTNVNNIIETSTTRHEEVPGFDKYSTSTNSYQYNKNGYPVKVNENGNAFEYNY